MLLLIKNAHYFNEPGSEIYKVGHFTAPSLCSPPLCFPSSFYDWSSMSDFVCLAGEHSPQVCHQPLRRAGEKVSDCPQEHVRHLV